MRRIVLILLSFVITSLCANAQIGYQISLLNTATGEPRANESVVVTAALSNSANEVFFSETMSAVTNDFGVLSLSIGNENTFKNVDLSKMPFFISITANGTLIGKSQILSVPVAEVAKRVMPLKKEDIVGKWVNTHDNNYFYNINNDGTINYNYENYTATGTYYISGELLIINWTGGDVVAMLFYNHNIIAIVNNTLIGYSMTEEPHATYIRKQISDE